METIIRNTIYDILENKFGVSVKTNPENTGDLNLFGHLLRLTPRDMLYMFFMLEEHFEIAFNESDVDNNSFYTIDGLTNIINNKLSTI